MLTNVWNTLMPGGRKRQSQLPQQTVPEAGEVVVPDRTLVEQAQDASGGPCLIKEVQRCGCTANTCSCNEGGCSCSECGCVCAIRNSKATDLERVVSALEAALADGGQQQEQQLTESLDESLPETGCVPEPNDRRLVTEHSETHMAGNEEADPSAEAQSLGGVCSPNNPETKEKEKDLKHEEHPSLAGCVIQPGEQVTLPEPRTQSEHPEGWEHIRIDGLGHTAGGETSSSVDPSPGGPPIGIALPIGGSRGRRSRKADSSAGWSSPPTEFEYVTDSPLCDARRLLWLSHGQQLRGWGWAYAGLLPAPQQNRSSSTNAAANAATSAAAAAAAVGGLAARRGSSVVQLLSSAVLSGARPRKDGHKRRGSLDGTAWDTGISSGGPLMVSGWCGRWQLTSVDSPRGSLSSYCSGERRHKDHTSGASSSCRDVESPGSRSRKRPAQPLLQEGADAADSEVPPPASSAAVSFHETISDKPQESGVCQEASSPVAPSATGGAAECEASCSSTEFSEPAGTGCSDDAAARRLQDLLLHRAQRHLERQCRRRLQREDWRLNILVAALPGIDSNSFCKQMFAEWQQIRRHQVSCGEEFIFQLRSAAPFVEVSVIAAATFTSALPYCELRLLEKWGEDNGTQQETSERRVHICLFLIPASAVPLPTGVLALLKRLRAVACLLPLLVVQQPISQDQLSRATGSLRLQLAASDLATLEEMLLPVHPSAGPAEPSACSHCQQQQTQQDFQQSQDQQQQEETPSTVEENNDSEICASNRKSASPSLPEVVNSEGESCSSSSSKSSSRLSSKRKASGDEVGNYPAGREGEGGAPTPRRRSNSSSYGGAVLCRSAVHLPLVLHLPPCSGNENGTSACSCWIGSESRRSSVATPSALRLMLVEASAMLLRERAEYGCFLPFLFQHQLQPNQTRKLRGLERWEEEEKQHQRQQQHVQALIEMRQGQINDSTQAATKAQLQEQLNELRQQLQKMQQQLLQLQQQKFLQKLLREEAQGAQSFPASHGGLLLPGSNTETDEREELLPHIAQMGLVLALMMGVGALLFTTIKRSNH